MRLFSYKLTTKNSTFVLTNNKNPSPFFKEFRESDSVCFVSIKKIDQEKQTKCPLCKTGSLFKVEHEGKYFVGCSNYPKCRYTLKDATILLNPKKCPACGGFLIKRKGKNHHWFIGCTNYPYCEYTEEIQKDSSGKWLNIQQIYVAYSTTSSTASFQVIDFTLRRTSFWMSGKRQTVIVSPGRT